MKPFSIARLVALFGLALVAGCDRPDAHGGAPTVTLIEHDAGAQSAGGVARAWPVVVSIVIDQEAAWIADERWPLLPADGGIARLRREGTYARDMRYAHAATDTAPGHAALYTGAPPRVSGIWGNEVLDPTTHERVSILRDPATKLVPSLGVDRAARSADAPSAAETTPGASSGPLKVDTVADRFRAAHRDALIVSLSIKDRGAIFGGGRAPNATLWFDKDRDRFVTSTAFSPTFPAWAEPLAIPTEARAAPWTLLDAEWVKSHAATPDSEPGEGELGGMPIVFPHDVAHARSPAVAFRGSPFADDTILGLALAAMSAENAGHRPTLVALSFSANDYVGHAFGPDSWEAWDELRRLDASLGHFFAQLDERFGPAGWSAILSGDHGVTTMPEATAIPATRPWCASKKSADAGTDRWERACGTVGRLMPDELAKELTSVASKTLGADRAAQGADAPSANATEPLVMGVVDPYVYLTPAARALPPADLARLEQALVAALLRHPEVDRVIDTSGLPATCAADGDQSVDALVCRAFVPGRAGDLYVLVKRGSFFDPNVVVGKGTSHGSPYLFDRSVPLLVRAPGRVAAGRVLDAPISFRVFARTLSTLLGIEPPNFEAARALDLAKQR